MSMVATVARTGLSPSSGWSEEREEGAGARAAATPAPGEAHRPLLELDGINSFYGPVQAHFDLSLQVRPGQIVCLLGGNASGKSTTMKVVLGLLKPRSGALRFDGRSIAGLSTPQVIRLGIGSVPEARRLFPAMSVRENLLMGAYARRDRKAVAEDFERMLDLFPRVAERIDFQAGTLSGGEQQMVAMARALMGRPRLLCMDEPTMGLSPLYVDKVLELIAQINRQGVSVFMVEQNASLALQIAHHGYVLQTGRIVLQGTASDLLADPRIRDAYLGGGDAARTAS
jgi:branched-chain amino acid transport system ATP-binding protein